MGATNSIATLNSTAIKRSKGAHDEPDAIINEVSKNFEPSRPWWSGFSTADEVGRRSLSNHGRSREVSCCLYVPDEASLGALQRFRLSSESTIPHASLKGWSSARRAGPGRSRWRVAGTSHRGARLVLATCRINLMQKAGLGRIALRRASTSAIIIGMLGRGCVTRVDLGILLLGHVRRLERNEAVRTRSAADGESGLRWRAE